MRERLQGSGGIPRTQPQLSCGEASISYAPRGDGEQIPFRATKALAPL